MPSEKPETSLPCGCRTAKQHPALPSAEAALHAAFSDTEIADLLGDLGPADGAAERVAKRRAGHPELYAGRKGD